MITQQGRIHVLLTGLLIVVLCGCSIIPQLERHIPKHVEQPITTAYQPFRIVQFCADTPPLFPARLMHQAAVAVAESIDSAVTVNFGGLLVFVSYISHNSFQNDVMQFAVPAFPADPVAPSSPKLGDDPYANAKAQSAYQTSVAAYQAHLTAQHQKLAVLRARVKQWTNKLRALPAPFDSTGADVYGCLQDASLHFHGQAGEKFLLIASPLINNTMLQASHHISLAGAFVRVIWHTCWVASDCQANTAFWQHLFVAFGAKNVTLFDPAQSAVETLTF